MDIVRRAAGDRPIDTDLGTFSVGELAVVFGDEWRRHQIEAAAGIVCKLARERGTIAMPGPVRRVWIGWRSVAEIEQGDPAEAADRLVSLVRRVQWPDSRYESASQFIAEGDGEQVTFAMLLPERACVLPKTDRLAMGEPGAPFMIPRSALAELPVDFVDLDDGNQLVEAIRMSDWSDVCRRAHAYEIRT